MPLRLSLLVFIALGWINSSAHAQELIGFSVEYGDTFIEWNIVPADEEIDLGELNLSWPYEKSWNDWQYQVDGRVGNIRQKWINRPNEWELIDGEYVVSIKNQWKGDLTIWRIKCEEFNLTYESRYTNIVDEWTLSTDKYGFFEVYTEYQGDPRDWIIEDGLLQEVPLALKMAMVFVSIYYSVPHK